MPCSSSLTYAFAPAGSRVPTTFASTSDSRRMRYSSAPTLISVPPYLEKTISSPSSRSIGTCWPLSSRLPGPTARTRPRCGFSFAVSGSTMPLTVVSSSSRTSTIRRSPSGCRFIHAPPIYDFVTPAGTLSLRVPGHLTKHPAGSATGSGDAHRLCYKVRVPREFSAGGVVVRSLRGRLMLAAIRPGGKPEGVWALPKGLVGAGEDPHATALREVAEETGVEASPGEKL